MCAIATFYFLWNGPSCRCYIKTAVQRQELYPMARWRSARAILRRIEPLVHGVQGVLEPVGPEQERVGAGSTPPFGSSFSPGSTANGVALPHRSRSPIYFFASLIALSALTGLFIFAPSIAGAISELLLGPVSVVCGIVALMSGRGTDLSRGPVMFVRVGVGVASYEMARVFVGSTMVGAGDPELAYDVWRRLGRMVAEAPTPGGFRYYAGLTECLLGLSIGLLGLSSFARYKSLQARGETGAGANNVSI
jgi:hypothetical protein